MQVMQLQGLSEHGGKVAVIDGGEDFQALHLVDVAFKTLIYSAEIYTCPAG